MTHLDRYRIAMERTAAVRFGRPLIVPMERPKLYTVISFGPREWLRYRGYNREGELEFLPPTPRLRVTIAEIQNLVADRFGIRRNEMTSSRRAREVARPRQVAMYLSKCLTPQSLPEIGRRFGGRDHTTVIHAVRQIEKLQKVDAELATHVAILLESFAA